MNWIIPPLVIIFAFIISALPLYLTVKMLGGKTTILKTIFVNIIAAIIYATINNMFFSGSIIAFVLLIWVYREMFRLKWFKALLAWLLQFIVLAILAFIVTLFGISFILFS